MTMILISETNNNNYTMLITSNISGFIYYTNFWYLHRLYEPQVYLTVLYVNIYIMIIHHIRQSTGTRQLNIEQIGNKSQNYTQR